MNFIYYSIIKIFEWLQIIHRTHFIKIFNFIKILHLHLNNLKKNLLKTLNERSDIPNKLNTTYALQHKIYYLPFHGTNCILISRTYLLLAKQMCNVHRSTWKSINKSVAWNRKYSLFLYRTFTFQICVQYAEC